MYINNLLIDRAEMDFRFCDTLRQREERVKDLCSYLAEQHFSKAFVAHQEPTFYLVADSKVNDIILESDLIDESDPNINNNRALILYANS